MSKRLILLAGILLFIGFVTDAFATASRASIKPLQSPSITRAGALAILIEADPVLKLRAQSIAKHMPPLPLFDDVDQNQWYAPYVEVAFENAFVLGNEERRFRPSEFLMPEEAVAILARYKNEGKPTWERTDGTNWFSADIANAEESDIPLPASLGTGKPITRNELFAMMRAAGILNPDQIQVPPTLFLVAYPQTTVVAESDFVNVVEEPVIMQPVQPANTYKPTTGIQPLPNAVTPRPQAVAQQPRPTQPAPVQQQPVQQAPANNAPAPSAKSFSISMPSLNIKDLTISHPSDPTTSKGLLAPLQAGVGHLFSYPGKNGKILVYGHSSSYPWDVSNYTKIFRQINKLNVGDKIYVTYNGTVYTYEVSFKEEVAVSDMSAYSGSGEELILYTCWPPDTIDKRYLVHAKPV